MSASIARRLALLEASRPKLSGQTQSEFSAAVAVLVDCIKGSGSNALPVDAVRTVARFRGLPDDSGAVLAWLHSIEEAC